MHVSFCIENWVDFDYFICLSYQLFNYAEHLAFCMVAETLEEELAELAALVEEAERLGFDPWPPSKPDRPWAKWALGSFMIVLMLSAVSKVLFRFVTF
tara:strand:- start:12913 stop:13206 length:294 start_codon:yes stop_codon:yes gene_type:complete